MASCGTKKRGPLRNPGHSNRPTTSLPGRTPTANLPKSGLEYIERYKGIAISEMDRYGIPASIKLAQALLESGNGTSYLATRANNHFGIKCGGIWNGRSMTKKDDNPNDCFRAYDNPEQSFRDHSDFLMRKRYEKLFTLDKNDYRGWAYGLKAAGYATNPRYPELLISLIERYRLDQYDHRDRSYIKKEKREERISHIIEEKVEEEKIVEPEKVKSPVAMRIHEVKNGDTLYAIAQKYNISVQEIVDQNGLTDQRITVGQLLVISP